MIENGTNLFWFFLTMVSCHDNLRSDSETEGCHQHNKYIDATEPRGSNSNFTYASKKSSVGYVNNRYRHKSEDEWVGDAPDVTI